MTFRQQKTNADVLIAIDRAPPPFADTEALDYLRGCLRVQNERHMTWLATIHGKGRSEKAASNWFSDACRKAGMIGENRRTDYGLRDTCRARLAENGAIAHQLMAWSGHKSLYEGERCTKEADKTSINQPITSFISDPIVKYF